MAVDRTAAGSGLAEVLDRLVTLELPLNSHSPGRARPRGAPQDAFLPGAPARLYRAARRVTGRPLADGAAEALLRRVRPGGQLLFTTGLVAPGIPRGETDGPSGAIGLARAVILGMRVSVVVLTEAESVAVLEITADALAAAEGDGPAWRRSLRVQAFPSDPEAAMVAARRIWIARAPAAVVSVEKLGPNAKGVIHNMLGQDVTPTQARTDFLFPLARRGGVLTIGVGDRGNEIGLGGLLRGAGRCACPCRGEVACVVRARMPVVAFSSNWGAHAVSAALADRLRNPRLLHRPKGEARMLHRMVRAGAVDGITLERTPTVDGGGLALQTAVVGMLAALVRGRIRAAPRS